jgi:hypothetical protein
MEGYRRSYNGILFRKTSKGGKMRIFLTILTLTFLTSADFTNDGVALTIDEGCTVTFDGDYESTGSLNLNGTLKTSGVLGDVNTIDHGLTSLVEFTGDNQTIPSDIYMNILLSGGGTKLVDDNMVIIQYDITIAEGNLDLNGGTLSMLGTSTLIEIPGNVVSGEGEIVANFSMPSEPTFTNYAGLGLSLNIFDVGGVERRHTAITNNENNSINRWYSVTVEEGAISDISFQYDETELNGLEESSLLLFHSVDGEHWNYIESILDTETNTLSTTAVEQNGHFTASSGGGCTDPEAANYDSEAFGDNGTCQYTISLSYGNNLISFPGTPNPNTTEELVETITEQYPECQAIFMIGQGLGLFNTEEGWSGNLNEVDPYSGYWLNVNCEMEWLVNIPKIKKAEDCLSYSISYGNNLVSYTGEEGAPILDAICNYSDDISFALGQGQGLFNTADGWSGNLNILNRYKGYWLNSTTAIENFTWGCECQESTSPVLASKIPEEEKIFNVMQSTEQAFYLIKELDVLGMIPQEGDYILAYRGNELIGSAEYEKDNTTLAVMGKDVTEGTENFPEAGESITLKIFNHKTMGTHQLNGEIPAWTSLGVSILDKLEGSSIIIPDNFVLEQPYPNPFNPTTTVKFGLPEDAEVSLRIYNLQGRMIEELTQGLMTAGYHSFQWNADNLSSGVYFVNLITKDFVSTQKLMLLK